MPREEMNKELSSLALLDSDNSEFRSGSKQPISLNAYRPVLHVAIYAGLRLV